MRRLTKEEVKRCTKLLNWKYETDQVTYWYVDELGKIQWREWEEGHHRQVSLADILFTKLWDSICELAKKKWGKEAHVYVQLDSQSYDKEFQAGAQRFVDCEHEEGHDAESNHPCLVLCEVIEKLKEIEAGEKG